MAKRPASHIVDGAICWTRPLRETILQCMLGWPTWNYLFDWFRRNKNSGFMWFNLKISKTSKMSTLFPSVNFTSGPLFKQIHTCAHIHMYACVYNLWSYVCMYVWPVVASSQDAPWRSWVLVFTPSYSPLQHWSVWPLEYSRNDGMSHLRIGDQL